MAKIHTVKGSHDLKIDRSIIYRAVGFALTDDTTPRIIVMLGNPADDGFLVTRAAAIMSLDEARGVAAQILDALKQAAKHGNG
jgi:hypothetical protein